MVSRLSDALLDDAWRADNVLGRSASLLAKWRRLVRAVGLLARLRRHWAFLGHYLGGTRLELRPLRRYWGKLGAQLRMRKQAGRLCLHAS